MLDVSQVPSSITAHAPGYIDRENERIVGLQTDPPLKRAHEFDLEHCPNGCSGIGSSESRTTAEGSKAAAVRRVSSRSDGISAMICNAARSSLSVPRQ